MTALFTGAAVLTAAAALVATLLVNPVAAALLVWTAVVVAVTWVACERRHEVGRMDREMAELRASAAIDAAWKLGGRIQRMIARPTIAQRAHRLATRRGAAR